MVRGVRTSLTLLFLVALLAAAAFWGWDAAMRPLPQAEDAPVCVDTAVAKGDKVYPDQVAVSVFNASARSGLATRTVETFGDEGFVEADSGNAPRGSNVKRTQIWTSDPKSPAVRLIKSRLPKKTTVVEGEALGVGVVVVVGDKFKDLRKGKKSVKALQDGFICSPVESQ